MLALNKLGNSRAAEPLLPVMLAAPCTKSPSAQRQTVRVQAELMKPPSKPSPLLSPPVLPSTCMVTALTFSTSSCVSKRLKCSWKHAAGSARPASGTTPSPQVSAAPQARAWPPCPRAPKPWDWALSPSHAALTSCLTDVHAREPDRGEGRMRPFHLHSLLC